MKEYEWNSVHLIKENFKEQKICKIDGGLFARIGNSDMLVTPTFYGGVLVTDNKNPDQLVVDVVTGRYYKVDFDELYSGNLIKSLEI